MLLTREAVAGSVRSMNSHHSPRRVSFLLNSMAAGGAETQARLLTKSVDRRRCEPHLAWYNTTESFHQPPEGVTAGPLPRRSRFDPGFFSALRQLSSRTHTDVLYAWQSTPAIYATTMRLLPGSAPIITAIRHSATLFAEHRNSNLLHPIASRVGDHTTVNCQDVIPWLEARGVPRSRITYIPNLLAPHLFQREVSTPAQRAALLTRLGLDPARPPITQVGRVDVNKNAHGLLQAILELRASGFEVPPLLLVGRLVDDALIAQLRKMAADAAYTDLHIHAPIQDVPTLMEASRVVALASHSEGTPNVVLEGMALGSVVVATQVGEVPNMIQHGHNGLSCRAGDVQQLAIEVKTALGMTAAARHKMGDRARADTRARHAPEAVLPQLYDLFDAVATRSHSPWIRPRTLLPPLTSFRR